MPTPRNQIYSLTSLRFVAAAMIVAQHFWGFTSGYAGVGFFFVLSGYVLAINYPTVDKVDFWRKRVARIYPLHLVVLLCALPLSPLLDNVPSLFLMQSWIPLRGFYLRRALLLCAVPLSHRHQGADASCFRRRDMFARVGLDRRLPKWGLAAWSDLFTTGANLRDVAYSMGFLYLSRHTSV
jgi:hypothetical protein